MIRAVRTNFHASLTTNLKINTPASRTKPAAIIIKMLFTISLIIDPYLLKD
jgi:hypothetical protein